MDSVRRVKARARKHVAGIGSRDVAIMNPSSLMQAP
jgi:hypothetical protein